MTENEREERRHRILREAFENNLESGENVRGADSYYLVAQTCQLEALLMISEALDRIADRLDDYQISSVPVEVVGGDR